MSASTVADARDRKLLRLMALGFGVGSLFFAVGQVVAYLVTDPTPSDWLFIIGALFFTFGATVQWYAAVVHHPDFDTWTSRALWDMTNPDWFSAVVQWIGTICFNVMTITALAVSSDDLYTDEPLVWESNMAGSAMFLVSSIIAMHSVVRLRRHRLVRSRSTLILLLNLVGSVLFGLSAMASKLVAPGVVRNESWVGIGTFWGALAFLAASLLMLPPPPRRGHDSAA